MREWIHLTAAALVCSAATAGAQTPVQIRLVEREATSLPAPPRVAQASEAPSPFESTPLPSEPAGGAIPHPAAKPAATPPPAPVQTAPATAVPVDSGAPTPFTRESSVAVPVPVPDGHEFVSDGCPCGKPGCSHSEQAPAPAPPVIEPNCGSNALPLRVCGDACEAPNYASCSSCGGAGCGSCTGGEVVRDTLRELLPCDRCGCDHGPWRLFPKLGARGNVNVYGWINGGGLVNGADSNFSGPVGFNDQNQLQLNQAYSVVEKRADGRCGLDVGGRVDVLWGSDYIFTEATGLERRANGAARWNSKADYGVALPQAYLEAAWNDLSLKLGHFYTLIGYESVMAPQNFFYSHAYTMLYGEPFTHTGMLMSYNLNEEWTAHGGLVNGWDRLDGISDSLGFLGGFNYAPAHGVYDLAFSIVSSSELDATGVSTSDRTLYSLVMNVNLTERLSYVLQHDHGWQDDYFGAGASAEWYGINQYLFYDVNECWALGGRFEWFRDDDGARVTGGRPGNPYAGPSPGNFFQIAAGVNYRPNSNVTLRPELRWDWYDGNGVRPFDANRNSSQFLGGMDVILHW